MLCGPMTALEYNMWALWQPFKAKLCCKPEHTGQLVWHYGNTLNCLVVNNYRNVMAQQFSFKNEKFLSFRTQVSYRKNSESWLTLITAHMCKITFGFIKHLHQVLCICQWIRVSLKPQDRAHYMHSAYCRTPVSSCRET